MWDFSYLSGVRPDLHAETLRAIDYQLSDPGASLGKTRLVAEHIARLVGAQKGVPKGEETFFEHLKKLDGQLPREVMRAFHRIRRPANVGQHEVGAMQNEAAIAIDNLEALVDWLRRNEPSGGWFGPPSPFDSPGDGRFYFRPAPPPPPPEYPKRNGTFTQPGPGRFLFRTKDRRDD